MSEEFLSTFLKNKKTAKKNLCDKLSLQHKMPLIGFVIDRELSTDDEKLIEKVLEGTMSLDVEIAVLADTNFDTFSFPHIHYIPYSEKNRKNLLEAADMMVALPHNDIEEWLINGVIPIADLRNGIMDYDPNRETGNSFVYGSFNNATPWNIFAALVRALETFKFPYDWKHIVNCGLDSVTRN